VVLCKLTILKLSLCDFRRKFCNNAAINEKGHAYKTLFELEKKFDLALDDTR